MRVLIAGYEKLKMYGFTVYGCINGGSNFCVYATLALYKRGDTLRAAFDKAVDAYEYPLCLRADMALCSETWLLRRPLWDRGCLMSEGLNPSSLAHQQPTRQANVRQHIQLYMARAN